MAHLEVYESGQSYAKFRARNLENSTTSYYGFRIRQVGTYYWTNWDSGWDDIVDSWYGGYASPIVTISGLPCGTNTSFECEAQAGNGSWYRVGSAVAGTTACPVPSAPYGLYMVWRASNGFNVSWSSVSGVSSYRLKIRRQYDNYTFYQTSYSTSATISGLQAAVSYGVSVQSVNSNGNSSWSSEVTMITAPTAPSISLNTTTTNSISISRGSMSGNWSYINVHRYNEWGTYLNTQQIYPSGTTTTFSGLYSNTTYSFYAETVYQWGGQNITSGQSNNVEATTSARPQNWYWTTSERNAFNGKGSVTTLTWTRWNDFIDKVNEFRAYVGYGYIDASAKMWSADRVMTAYRFNLVRYAIGNMYSTGLTDYSKGDKVMGSYFIALETALNNIP